MLISKLLQKLRFRSGFGLLMESQSTIMSAAAVLGFSSLISAILGLLKSRLLTYYFGVSPELAIFYTADRIPNLIYSVLVVGALSTVFIPVFTSLMSKNKTMAWEVASALITYGVLFFLLSSSLIAFFAQPIIHKLSFETFTPDQVLLGAEVMRIMLLAQVILVVSSFLTSILHSFKMFIVPAMAPVVYNLGMILGIFFLSPSLGIYGPAYGVLLGASLHLLVQLPLLRKVDFKYRLSLGWRAQHFSEVVHLLPPRILSVVFNQLVGTLNNSLAILVSTSSVVVLKFATQLQFIPVSLFGASIAAASLPVLSETSSDNDMGKFKSILLTTFHQMMFLVLPASVLLIILRVPVVRLVYGVQNFPWDATIQTSYALAFFALSIFSQSSLYLLTRAFYSLKDTLTPVKISFFTIVLTVSASILGIRVFGLGVWYIALVFSITSIIDMALHLFFLIRKIGGIDLNLLLVPFTKMSYASLFMGISLYVPLKVLDQLVFDTSRTLELLVLTGLVTVAGLASYIFFTWVFKVHEIRLLYSVLRSLNIMAAPIEKSATEIQKEASL